MYDKDGDGVGESTLIVNVNNEETVRLWDNTIAWWWSDSHTLVAGDVRNGLIQLDVETGDVLHRVPEIDFRGYQVNQYGSSSKVGFFNRERLFSVFDVEKGEITEFPNSVIPVDDLAYWISAPVEYISESVCRNP